MVSDRPCRMEQPCAQSHHRCRGVRVGHADDAKLASGVTAIMFDEPAVAAVDVRGGGPGTRETDAARRAPHGRAHRRHRAVRRLGLRARCRLRRAGLAARAGPRLCRPRRARADRAAARSCSICSTAATRTGAAIRPIASSAMRRRQRRGRRLRARQRRRGLRRDHRQPQGRARLGLGGDARRHHRRRARRGQRRAAASTIGDGPHFWAAPFEQRQRIRRPRLAGDGAAAGARFRAPRASPARTPRSRVVATDATLTKAQAKRLAVMAQDGLARAIYPVHTPLDGDIVFAAATGAAAARRSDLRPRRARRARRRTCWRARSRAASTRRAPCPFPARCRAGATSSGKVTGYCPSRPRSLRRGANLSTPLLAKISPTIATEIAT